MTNSSIPASDRADDPNSDRADDPNSDRADDPVSDRADDGRSVDLRLAIRVTAIAFLGLGVWALTPIFTDEIAFRQYLGRYVADHGVIYGLWEMCQSRIKAVPLAFAPVAWLLAQTMRILSPLEMRFLSFAAVLAVVFTTVRQTAGSRNPAAGVLVLGSFVGVAGVGLIIVRSEFALELHLLSCLVAAGRLARRRTGVPGDLGVTIGLVLAAALSVLSHPQGLLLLPLTSYFLLRLAVRRFGSVGLIAGPASFVLFVPLALAWNDLTCTEHPEIEAFLQRFTFDPSNLKPQRLALLLFQGANVYASSFRYAAEFPANVLPPVDGANGVMIATNVLISVVIVFFLALALGAPAVALVSSRKLFRFRPGSVAISELVEKNQPLVVATLITIPVVFLFVYDSQHNFYRNYYLNHFASVAACLMFSSLSGRVAVRVTKGACTIIGIAVGASLILNASLFVPPMWDGYETPVSQSLSRKSQVVHDTERLVGLCKMDLQRGRIVVDDVTQAGVFYRPVTIPVVYLRMQAELVGMSVRDAAISLRANYAILRCPDFVILGVAPQGKSGEICCYAFN